jgi:deoxycytidine triphosphate deaminase/intein/homing endonuclease
MILSDRELRAEIEAGRLVIEPFDPDAVQPSSIDLRVGSEFRVFANHRYPHIDVREPLDNLTELVEASEDEPFILHPGEFVLGTTLETVTLPDNLVARLEGKSSLGRLGLLIHSSLPGTEPVLFLHNGFLMQVPIEEVVRKRLAGSVVSFDPESFEIAYSEVTGWHETPADRIFEVTLASGRRIRLTGGHCVFTLDSRGDIRKARVQELGVGTRVAIARTIPDPPTLEAVLDLVALAPESAYPMLVCGGPNVAAAFERWPRELDALLRTAGISHASYYGKRASLPLGVALQHPTLVGTLGSSDWVSVRGGRHRLPVRMPVDDDLAWLLGLYLAEGSSRRTQITISNTNQEILERAQTILGRLSLPVYRSRGAITCCSALLAQLLEWLGMGGRARGKRIPHPLLGWPRPLISSFFDGFVAGDGSRGATRVSLWTSSEGLVGDLLLACARLGKRAGCSVRERAGRKLWEISVPHREHKLLTAVPVCDRLLVDIRREAGLTQAAAARAAGFGHATQLNNIERRRCDAIRLATLTCLRDAYAPFHPPTLPKLNRLIEGGLSWDTVVGVRDTGTTEPVFDLEVRPAARPTQNFLAGSGGVLVSNTAGFVDAGFSGQLTLELSNVANLPIAIYPGMLVGQLCLFQMTSPAERPYGSDKVGSKYQAQRGPTPSRFFENFRRS